MFPNVMPVADFSAKVAGRLINFKTGCAFLLTDHQNWLDANVQPVIQRMQKPWVRLIGYASHLGDAYRYDNQDLSTHRCDAVDARVSQYANQVNFVNPHGVSSSESTGGIQDNDGFWRAVTISVYATMPHSQPQPKTERSTHFQIRVLKGGSLSLPLPIPWGSPQDDLYWFRITDVENWKTPLIVIPARAPRRICRLCRSPLPTIRAAGGPSRPIGQSRFATSTDKQD